MQKKVFIATPAYDGRTHIPYTISLAETTCLLIQHGIQVMHRITATGSLLCAERNRLVKQFLATDATHMLLIDSDLGWQPNSVISMLLEDRDFVASVYPTRRENAFFFTPCLNPDGSVVKEGNLLKMKYIPAGFMLLKRCVLEKIIQDNPQLYFEPKAPMPDENGVTLNVAPMSDQEKYEKSGYCLFNTELYEGEFWGEDYVFCRLARNSGFDIWVNPMFYFDHAGVQGAMIQALTNNKDGLQDGSNNA